MAARRKMITKKTGAISKVICLDLPALDEDYDQDTMIFLQAQRIFEVKTICKHQLMTLKDSPLIEELEARVEILVALANIKAAEEAKRKKAYDEQFENFSEYGAKLRQENCLLVIRHEIVCKDLTQNLGEIVGLKLKACLNTTINKPTHCDYVAYMA
ncbi:hypothetical protein DCAR_0934513 [Daucus carota subsp. sativus]|uniref:Uncharacterized protein n=1 Tax=Daucus carota subsp. sativus TaxID=79200 RepID=A0A175YCA9_DAUCS|nr:hypothetical protein DCAR_0934513 [Daucus carota subsp. sativus]